MIAMAMAGLDFSEPALQGELDACAGVLSSGALDLTADPELRALVQSRLESFARCVGVEGVTGFPGPVDPFDGVGPPFPSDEVPWDDPLLAEAVGACVVTLGVGSR